MEAKETVTLTNEENCHNTLEERLLEQAERTETLLKDQWIKAGQLEQQVKDTKYYAEKLKEVTDRVRQAARREVVEKTKELGIGTWSPEWQAQIKKWNL